MKRFFSTFGERVLEAGSARVFLTLCALWLGLSAGIRPLTLPDEGRYIGVAWEMLNSGNWLVPTLDGMPFFHKPPLFYWITALGLKLFGANEWAGRLAPMLAALTAAITLHIFVRRYVNQWTANLAVAVLATLPFFYVGAQFSNLDMLVAGMISATIVSGASAVLALDKGQPHRSLLTVAYIFAALGVLAKGLIGIVLPGAILFAWIIVTRKYRLILALFPITLLLLFAVLVTPWFWLMEKTHPGFLHYFFVYHHFQRFSETGFNNQQAVWFYVPVLLALALPWSLWIWRAFNRKFLFDKERFDVRSLMVLWLLGIVGFFSLPNSKLVGYILPALPPFAFLIADAILSWRSRTKAAAPSAPSPYLGACLIFSAALCFTIIPVAGQLDKVSFKKVLTTVEPKFQPEDQMVMIEEYQYDMPFYLRATNPAWVVSNWKDPVIPKNDDSRKELFDAGQFNPAMMQKVLLLPADFTSRLCQQSEGTLWVWGKTEEVPNYPFLESSTIASTAGKKALWRLDTPFRKQLTICRGMPNNG
ncbi:MAG: glycosyltransferase family 39 protein [Betaproteobacteria bacterium]